MSSTSSGAISLILLQVSSRLVTFILNQSLVRLTSPAIFGAANIQLELLLSSILFLSREGVRSALLRTNSSEASSATSLTSSDRSKHNIAFLPIPIGAFISLIATFLYTENAHFSLKSQPNFNLSVCLYALGALVELCSEPLYIRAQTQMKVNLRVRAEGSAVLAKCLVTVITVALPRMSTNNPKVQEAGLIAFGLGQAAYGLVTFGVYLLAYLKTDGLEGLKNLLTIEKPVEKSDQLVLSYFDPSTLSLAWAMVKQSILKHLLTEGDKFAVAKLATLSDQGGYALASNYGSLVARMIFQPIEESSRLVFSRELGSVESESTKGSSYSLTSLQKSQNLLSSLFKLHFLLSLFFLTFGPPLSFPLLYFIAGSKWSSTSAPSILEAYCYYLPIMGLNGIVEAFLQATANKKDLAFYSKILIFASLVFGFSLFGFNRCGTSILGLEETHPKEVFLVWSSSISLAIRGTSCWAYLIRFFIHSKRELGTVDQKRLELKGIYPWNPLPRIPTLMVFLLSRTVLNINYRDSGIPKVEGIRDLLPHFKVGAGCLGACLITCLIFERRSIIQSLSALRGSRTKTKTE